MPSVRSDSPVMIATRSFLLFSISRPEDGTGAAAALCKGAT